MMFAQSVGCVNAKGTICPDCNGLLRDTGVGNSIWSQCKMAAGALVPDILLKGVPASAGGLRGCYGLPLVVI